MSGADAAGGGGGAGGGPMTRERINGLPVRAYLDEMCVPLVMQALAAVARERPDDPIDYIAHFLLKHNPGPGSLPHNPRRLTDAQPPPRSGGGGGGGYNL